MNLDLIDSLTREIKGWSMRAEDRHIRFMELKSRSKILLDAAENLENDDGSIPQHAWDLLQDAIKNYKSPIDPSPKT